MQVQNVQQHISTCTHHRWELHHLPICCTQARGSLICHLTLYRDSTTFRRDFWGRKQLQVQLDNALEESMRIKSPHQKGESHQHQVLLQHSRSQHLCSAMVCLHDHITDSSEHNARLGSGAMWFAAHPSCRNSFTLRHTTTRVW